MKRTPWHLLFALISGCASVHITPKTIREVSGRQSDGDAAVASLTQAVAIANEFLKPDFRRTLPAGCFLLSDDGITFQAVNQALRLDIRCSVAGDLLVPFHMAAQERASGFVVGLEKPREYRAIDNSLFRQSNGVLLHDFEIAGLILHELTHCYYRLGTVSFGQGLKYYSEVIFLFRYRKHSMERLPFLTSSEYVAFVRDHFEREGKGAPNKAREATATAGMSAAGQPPRQPAAGGWL